MQSSEFKYKMDCILSSLKPDLNGGGQLRTLSDLFGGKAFDNCRVLIGCKETAWDKPRRERGHRGLHGGLKRHKGSTMGVQVHISKMKVGCVSVDFVYDEFELTPDTHAIIHIAQLGIELTNGFSCST